MKIRTDFVTNSSSSSFVIAMKQNISDEDKIKIADYVLSKIMGKKILTPASSPEEVNSALSKLYYRPEKFKPEVEKCLSQNMDIYGGTIDFELMFGEEYVNIVKGVWKILSENNAAVEVDTDLRY